MSENIIQSALELWDVNEAIKQITHDGLLDTIGVMNQPSYFINQMGASNLNKVAAEIRIKGMFNIELPPVFRLPTGEQFYAISLSFC